MAQLRNKKPGRETGQKAKILDLGKKTHANPITEMVDDELQKPHPAGKRDGRTPELGVDPNTKFKPPGFINTEFSVKCYCLTS